LWLIGVYAVSTGLYLAFVLYGYRVVSGRVLFIEWTVVAALAAVALVGWITLVNLLYLITQIAIAVDGVGLRDGVAAAGAVAHGAAHFVGRRCASSARASASWPPWSASCSS
jgi:hypothetical protein